MIKLQTKPVKKILIMLFLFYTTVGMPLPPQYSESEIKAMYIIKFAHFTKWKGEKINGEKIIIGVYGKSVVTKYLHKYIKSKINENKDLKIVEVKSFDEILKCNILFMPKIGKLEVTSLLKKLKNKPILTISNNRKFLQKGVMINMYPKGRKVVYNVNKKSVDFANLKLSPKIYKLAIKVGE